LIFIEPLSFHRWRYFNFLPKRYSSYARDKL
jgi:hypothetical protein